MAISHLFRPLCRVVTATVFLVIACASHAAAQSVTLGWDPNPESDIAGYRVEYGTVSGSPTTTVDVGNVTTRSFSGLQFGVTYYFRIRAYNTSAQVSSPSSEVSYMPVSTPPAPTLTAVAPTSGPTAGGTVITLTGTNFASGATVRVNGVTATGVTVLSTTQITATTPAGTAGARTVQVTNTDGQSASLSSAFTYVAPAPTETSVSPTSGPASGGTVITIAGTGFVSGATVRVNGVAASGITFVSSTQLRATTPAGSAGARSVQVTNPDGQSAMLSSAFTYMAAPTVTSVSPASGPTAGGTTITITGTGFVAGATVRVGSTSASSVTFVSATSLRAVTPAGSGAQSVQVTNPDAQASTLANAFTYRAAPTVTSVSPSSGPTAGGTAITVTGTNFLAGATVRVGGSAATSVSVVSATSITAVTPAGSAGGQSVQVTNTDGQSGTRAAAFTYTAPTAGPTLTAITPATGPTAGGTAVTLTGANFQSGATVTIGGASATSVVFVSATSITAVTPAGTAGARDVRVSQTSGASTLSASFTYVAGGSSGDTDGDGLPNTWETQFGLDPNSAAGVNGANGDPDGDGATNAEEYAAGTHPRGTLKRYLAEGASNGFFDTRLAIANPQTAAAHVLLTFLDASGRTTRKALTIPARSRATVKASDVAELAGASFATTLEADQVVVLDRLMSWSGELGYAGHMATAVQSPSTSWYLAEGATHGNFELFYLMMNPSAQNADVKVRYILPAGAPIEKTYQVGAGSRATIWVDQEDPALAATDVSAEITSTNGVPIIVERSMYLNVPGKPFKGGHNSPGATAPGTSWFFAEGSTGKVFSEFLLFANPTAQTATLEATYLRTNGSPIVKTYTVAPTSRKTINVALESGALSATSVSAKVVSTNGVPVIVERTMWWTGATSAWTEGHNAFGAVRTAPKWVVAEGEQGGAKGLSTFVLIANTSAADATVKVTLLPESGAEESRTYTVKSNQRFTVPASDFAGANGHRFSFIVESQNPATAGALAVERSLYWNTAEAVWDAGDDSVGAIVP